MPSRRLHVPSRLATALIATLALAGLASADVLTLHGGATLEGRVVEQRGNEIIFEHRLGGQKTRSVFERSVVQKLEITSGLGTVEAPCAVTSERYPEAKTYEKRVGIVLDRSGSMAI